MCRGQATIIFLLSPILTLEFTKLFNLVLDIWHLLAICYHLATQCVNRSVCHDQGSSSAPTAALYLLRSLWIGLLLHAWQVLLFSKRPDRREDLRMVLLARRLSRLADHSAEAILIVYLRERGIAEFVQAILAAINDGVGTRSDIVCFSSRQNWLLCLRLLGWKLWPTGRGHPATALRFIVEEVSWEAFPCQNSWWLSLLQLMGHYTVMHWGCLASRVVTADQVGDCFIGIGLS